ncbi:hypothetical protein DYD21_12405 [Rhodohalobacter sp. SW132]|uniref:FG-GAP-like repeat-containing protein n=1 Tax=Rhodohalobacter sp. SW132 TaxID=2293433 RepID=UPI000E269690|nr:FG-GAP-like repeat-containing protein [Rhodohalobacter sp. SW132]REL33056.1 hypothetical protein DYD21_12405 [Rhodohalobacter sp. SW132]
MPLRHIAISILSLLMLLILSACSSDGELNWVEEEGYRWAELQTSFFGDTGFRELSSGKTGINFRLDVPDDLIQQNRHYSNGSGVAVGDVTGNGYPDIYFASLTGSNRLFENRGGYSFEDITEQAGVAHEGFNSTGVAMADVNGNGFLDILITSLSDGNVLYLNNGEGRFEINENSGLGESNGAHSMALADINGNGLLDLYIANYRLESVRDLYGPDDLSMENTAIEQDGRMTVLPEFEEFYQFIEIDGQEFRQESGAYDELYINRGDGSFEKANPDEYFILNDEGEAGLLQDWGFTPAFRDITGNGAPDLYITNDFWTPDRFWLNNGDGTFQTVPPDAIKNQSYSSMGMDFTDLNKNGLPDFVVTEMLSGDHSRRIRQYSDYMGEYHGSTHHNHNSVYLNRGDTTFAQIPYYSGLEATEWSWATLFMDVNLNGYEDLIVATGFYRDYLDMDAQQEIHQRYQQMGDRLFEEGEFMQFPVLNLGNQLFQNNGDMTFSDVSRDWGFTIDDISMGMAAADLNNNGTLDLIFNRFNNEAVIYENRTNNPRIAVRLAGKSPNTAGIGAKIELSGGPVIQQKEMVSGSIYLSDSQKQVVFAADESNPDHTITVTWRDGTQSIINNVQPNRLYEIDQEATAVETTEPENTYQPATPLFADISDRINHIHHESSYNDFQRVQPLLPKQLSRQGPGAAWFDVTGNGFDDLLITSGRGGSLSVFENSGDGDFSPIQTDPTSREAPGDQTAVIAWSENDQRNVMVGSANYEQGNPGVPSAYRFQFRDGGEAVTDSIPGVLSTTGPLAAADYSGNGYVDLFVGGSFLPGGYPRNASSRLFTNRNGELTLDEANSERLADAGLVSSALFADFTQNGYQDLLVSTEWGSIKLYENRNGQFREITNAMGLNRYTGWWNGIASGDFTNNGLTDFVAVNIGRNTPYRTNTDHPIRLYYEDLNLNNQLDIVDAYYHEEMNGYVPRRKLLDFRSVRTILQNVQSHTEFSESTVDKIFDMDFANVPYKEINTVEHMVFINTGDGFEAHPLPSKAQFSNGYSVIVADFDNDGNEDLFISQNSFEYPPEIARQDAGRGLILMGNGEGQFIPKPGRESGIKVYGEQRGAAISDFNRNGKTDLVVTQNSGETRLFENRTPSSGIRVTLIGPDTNRDAVGSSIRITYENGSKGPLRTLQAGSGYRSQNSFTQVMGIGGMPESLEVNWFDGRSETIIIERGVLEYEIRYDE